MRDAIVAGVSDTGTYHVRAWPESHSTACGKAWVEGPDVPARNVPGDRRCGSKGCRSYFKRADEEAES